MALREDRQVFHTNVECTVSGVSERGGILSFDPVANGLCLYADATAVSGSLVQPAGLLLDDVEALNHYRHPQYRQRNVVNTGEVVGIATEGEFTTDFVETTLAGVSVGTYAPGDLLFLGDNGQISRNNGTFGNAGTAIRPQIGRALSAVNGGFLKFRLEL